MTTPSTPTPASHPESVVFDMDDAGSLHLRCTRPDCGSRGWFLPDVEGDGMWPNGVAAPDVVAWITGHAPRTEYPAEGAPPA